MAKHTKESAIRFIEASSLSDDAKVNLKRKLGAGVSPDDVVSEIKHSQGAVKSYQTKGNPNFNTR